MTDKTRTIPGVTDDRLALLKSYNALLQDFNRNVNLVSRASAHETWDRHIMHSLALAAKLFPSGSVVADVGTGGGLPGIPLAILFSDVHFILIDSTAKKLRAVEQMVDQLGLSNVSIWHGRAAAWDGTCSYSVSRAAAPLADLWKWHKRVHVPYTGELSDEHWKPGILALKGGDLTNEIRHLRTAAGDVPIEQIPVSELVPAVDFADKFIVHVLRGARIPGFPSGAGRHR